MHRTSWWQWFLGWISNRKIKHWMEHEGKSKSRFVPDWSTGPLCEDCRVCSWLGRILHAKNVPILHGKSLPAFLDVALHPRG
jgi:hypothetical protein